MKTNEIKITVPEGMEIDKENSTFECIKFKKKSITYNNLVSYLFGKECYYIEDKGRIMRAFTKFKNSSDPNNAISQKQLEKLLAINKLMNVAKYLNGDWKPNLDSTEEKYYLYLDSDNVTHTASTISNNSFVVYFRRPYYIKQAIDILGEDTIRLALSTDW